MKKVDGKSDPKCKNIEYLRLPCTMNAMNKIPKYFNLRKTHHSFPGTLTIFHRLILAGVILSDLSTEIQILCLLSHFHQGVRTNIPKIQNIASKSYNVLCHYQYSTDWKAKYLKNDKAMKAPLLTLLYYVMFYYPVFLTCCFPSVLAWGFQQLW